jgi:5-methylcytosine-specific restriction endonuclease McrA
MCETRVCRLCNETKPLEEFEIDRRYKDGHYTRRCRACKYKTQTRAVVAYKHLQERSAKLGIDVEVTLDELKRLFEVFDGTCIYCGAKESADGPTFHLDHIISLSEGGSNHISNLVIACPSDNLRKNKKPVITFYFDNERFKENHFVILAHYISLTSGQPVEDVVMDLTNQHVNYESNRIFEELGKSLRARGEIA